ncbi:hypothetical protein DFH06DRAFT_458900 [Mycena polygramma]|nr:hypothetical protein DFH06DRAFT_458900 [Mycena polygramma]
MDMRAYADEQLVRSTTKDWVAQMILAVKMVAAGAEFVPAPYVRAAFSIVVAVLEIVEKVKKNRDDLRDLCAGIVEIVRLIRDEMSAHNSLANKRLMGLCENFIAFLGLLESGLKRLILGRSGVRGRLKELFGAASVGDQIERYKTRINELRANFLLAATINTNMHVAGIERVLALGEARSMVNQFRHVTLGDINLIREVTTGTVQKIKIFTAQISGQQSTMTVAQYPGDDDKWRQDLELYSRFRHPNVWQLFGFSSVPGLHTLIFHDEMIPFAIYRQYHRPPSDFVWACIEGMLVGFPLLEYPSFDVICHAHDQFKQFKANFIYSQRLEAYD